MQLVTTARLVGKYLPPIPANITVKLGGTVTERIFVWNVKRTDKNEEMTMVSGGDVLGSWYREALEPGPCCAVPCPPPPPPSSPLLVAVAGVAPRERWGRGRRGGKGYCGAGNGGRGRGGGEGGLGEGGGGRGVEG